MTLLNASEKIDKSSSSCSCTAGQGFCHHQLALLYQLSHYQSLGVQKIPEIVSKTSRPQDWHVPPRVHGFDPRPANDIVIVKPPQPSQTQTQPTRRTFQGCKSKLYNPITVPLSELSIRDKLWPTLSSDAVSKTQWSQLWSLGEKPPLVDSAFGPVPKGSVLSYQHPLKEEPTFVGPSEPPKLHLPSLPLYEANIAVSQQQLDHIASLGVTNDEALEYEQHTRKQGACPEWHKLRKMRLTSSNFKQVTARRNHHDRLATELLTKSAKKTAAMEFGTRNEPTAAKQYATLFGVDIHDVGFIINPSRPYLGCSPDRRVFDPARGWGLLEIKCSPKDTVHELCYLQHTEDGLQLRHSHRYYEQIMGQMALTGSPWCDFFVWTVNDYHMETVQFDEEFFKAMLEKLDDFFFRHFLPASLASE